MNCSHRFPFTWQNKALRRRIHLWMFLFPSFLGTMVFMILPFGDVIRRSFLTVVTQKWVGLQITVVPPEFPPWAGTLAL